MSEHHYPSPPNDPQFVILRHELATIPKQRDRSLRDAPIHFDWMFQVGESLLTWSTASVADLAGDLILDAIQLANHRTAYLEIQGDIGGGRGSVTRLVRGQLSSLVISENLYEAELQWPQLDDLAIQRHVTIQRISVADPWRLRLDRGL